MIIDKLTEFADATSVVLTAGTWTNIGSQVDRGAAGLDLGNGQPVYLVITVDTAIITGGSAGTIQFRLASDDTATIHATTSTVHWTSAAFVTDDAALNDLDVGEVVACLALPLNGQAPYEEFVGVQAIANTTDTTAGKINAFLTLDPTGWKAYPDASN